MTLHCHTEQKMCRIHLRQTNILYCILCHWDLYRFHWNLILLLCFFLINLTRKRNISSLNKKLFTQIQYHQKTKYLFFLHQINFSQLQTQFQPSHWPFILKMVKINFKMQKENVTIDMYIWKRNSYKQVIHSNICIGHIKIIFTS